MAVKVFIKRNVPEGKEADLLNSILKLRTLATRQSGYISGETLRNVDNSNEYLVISTWQSIDDWDAWFTSDDRREIQKEIERLLGNETEYTVYYYPEKGTTSLSGFRGWEGG